MLREWSYSFLPLQELTYERCNFICSGIKSKVPRVNNVNLSVRYIPARQPRPLVIWGKYDPSFDLSEPEAYRIVVSALEVLYRWADDHLIDFHLDRLLNCVSDRSGDCACRDGHFHELAQILSGRFV